MIVAFLSYFEEILTTSLMSHLKIDYQISSAVGGTSQGVDAPLDKLDRVVAHDGLDVTILLLFL